MVLVLVSLLLRCPVAHVSVGKAHSTGKRSSLAGLAGMDKSQGGFDGFVLSTHPRF